MLINLCDNQANNNPKSNSNNNNQSIHKTRSRFHQVMSDRKPASPSTFTNDEIPDSVFGLDGYNYIYNFAVRLYEPFIAMFLLAPSERLERGGNVSFIQLSWSLRNMKPSNVTDYVRLY